MNRTVLLALGIFFTIAASVTGLVIIPNWQFQDLMTGPPVAGQAGEIRPPALVLAGGNPHSILRIRKMPIATGRHRRVPPRRLARASAIMLG